MEADCIASPLEDCTAKVVIQHHPRNRAPTGERFDVAAQEVVHRGVQIKSQEQVPRVRQHHHEGHQWPGRLTDFDRTEVRPVALGLLAGQGAQPQIRLGNRSRSQARDDGPEVIRAAAITAIAHDVQTARA